MSSSALQLVLTSIQQNDYATLAILTVIGYDYVLIFPNEIEYIWSKPWTGVSTLFILVRYVGLLSLIGPTLSEVFQNLSGWTFVLFYGAADLVMILRVWAMYRGSRLVLGALLTLFFLEIICILTVTGVGNYPNVSVTTVQILNISVCVVGAVRPIWTQAAAISKIIFGTVVCMLAIVEFMKQTLQVYHATKQWQFNRYMKLLLQQDIFYFLFIFVFNLISVLSASGYLPTQGWQVIPLFIVEIIPVYTLTPRFIIGIRKLYALDSRGRRTGIDTGFGLSSLSSGHGVGGMVFADVGLDEEVEDVGVEETRMPMEVAQSDMVEMAAGSS